MAEVLNTKYQPQKINIVDVEVKEELKMKQASYVAEVHSRLQYQKALERIVEQSSQGSRFVGDVLAVSDECEDEYMSGPAGTRSIFADALSLPPDQTGSESSVTYHQKSNFDVEGVRASICCYTISSNYM